MALSFGTSVALKNFLALRDFRTYLNNYKQHEMPRGKRNGFFVRLVERLIVDFLIKSVWMSTRQRFVIEFAKRLVEAQAMKTMADLIVDLDAKKASVSLNDVPPAMFGLLYIVQNPHTIVDAKTARELFDVVNDLELQFALVKKPRENISHEPRP